MTQINLWCDDLQAGGLVLLQLRNQIYHVSQWRVLWNAWWLFNIEVYQPSCQCCLILHPALTSTIRTILSLSHSQLEQLLRARQYGDALSAAMSMWERICLMISSARYVSMVRMILRGRKYNANKKICWFLANMSSITYLPVQIIVLSPKTIYILCPPFMLYLT